MKNKLNFPVKAAESPVNLSEQFSSSHAAFVVWWYGGVTKNDDFNQPKVILVLREFLADNRLGEYFTRSVPITLLGQARIGSFNCVRLISRISAYSASKSALINLGFFSHNSIAFIRLPRVRASS